MEMPRQKGTRELKMYESICDLSEKMVSVAKKGDWDSISTIEKKRTRLIEAVRSLTKESLSKDDEVQRKVDLIQRILLADSTTKVLVKERMQRLQTGFYTERKLLKTYGQKILS